MASPEELDAAAAYTATSSRRTYPEEEEKGYADDGERKSEVSKDFSTSKQSKEQGEAEKKEHEDGAQNLKSTLLISGVVVAVIGAIFAIVKKIKEA
ncbi:unnamed protein product [Ilex paraguariensis]|uniref:Uncharacterized protein n=1 Tax=Ilex paraguariensis TaxID=185542 RepID=A0ABC8UUE9_9AQUA